MITQPEDFFSIMSHPMRLRTTLLLHTEGELCVCELMHVLDLQQPVMSRHLAQLKETGLAHSRKQGQWVFYRINENLPSWMQNVLTQTAQGISNQAPHKDDLASIKKMKFKPEQACK